MLLFDNFKETIFLKKSSSLEQKYLALTELLSKYPNNEELQEEYFIIKKGLDGENEIQYQLEKSNLGMYVLRDINLRFENLTAQIDYVIFTKALVYFIECKNLIGNITIDNNGNFIREYVFKGKKIRKGMYSPLRQVEAQREVFYKIWNSNANILQKLMISNKLNNNYKILVVAANNETILNTRFAPKDIKEKVLKSDSLIRKLQYDVEHSNTLLSKSEIEKNAHNFLKICTNIEENYLEIYQNKYNLISENKKINVIKLKEALINFRKNRSSEMNIPAYYVFNNEELEKIIEIMPKTINELKNANILSSIKIKTHGEKIIEIINSSENI